ncbi:CU044_5270 family protein [Micromonospora sp. CPCC 205539]|uniref:CU044_5270 family protein n=1 Tax=Micromonospora sp. CPCC 205539 TaxID=3122408 RepID=UPI002FF19A30
MNRHHRALQLIAEARPAVLDDAPDRPVPPFPDRPAPGRPARRTRRRLVLAGLPTVAAVAVGVAVVVSLANPPAGSPPVDQSVDPIRPVTAQGILLAAAEKTTTTVAPASADYWVTEVELHHVYDVGNYHVLGRSTVETWYALGSDRAVTTVARSLGAAPATDADRAAWRAAGSPTRWLLKGPDGEQRGGRELLATSSPRKVSVRSGGLFEIGGTPVTYAQIRALPTDPEKLKAYLIELDDAAGRNGSWTPDQVAGWRVEMLFSQSWALLSELPVAPAVRAATYRMLATLPGLTTAGPVRDAKGRAGAGISYAYRNADGTSVETRLVIDPESGSLLAREQKSEASVLVDARFSDVAPPRS